MVEVLLYLTQILFAASLDIAVDIGLLAALVVGIGIIHAATGCPLVIVCPAVGIVEVALLRVYLVERHQSFVIYGTGPKVARAYLLDIGVEGWVTVLRHEVVVGAL